jgi:hypothetical protein
MDKSAKRKLTENQVVFRQVNSIGKEFVLEAGRGKIYDKQPLYFYCECSDLKCHERIMLTAEKYDKVRKNNKQFVIKPGHQIPEIENVVLEENKYFVVEKIQNPPGFQKIDPRQLN